MFNIKRMMSELRLILMYLPHHKPTRYQLIDLGRRHHSSYKGLHSSDHSISHQHVCVTSPCPSNPMAELQNSYKHVQVCGGLSYSSGQLKLGNPSHLSKSRLCPRGGTTSSFSVVQSFISSNLHVGMCSVS